MLSVSSLTRVFGSHTAVDHISFSLEPGTITGLLGPNGAGKSTTMKMVTGAISPTDGKITVMGHDMIDEPVEAKHRIGYLPESPPLYEDLTVIEYLDHICRLRRLKTSRKTETQRVLEITGTYEMRNRLCRNLSKGYRQRVGTAAALIGNPPVIILDEPTSGLDPEQVVQIRETLISLKEDHIILISSHILSEIEMLCDRLIIMSGGSVVASGTTDEISKTISRERAVEVIIKTGIGQTEELLETDKHITIHNISAGEEAHTTVCVLSSTEGDIRTKLFSICADRKIPILHMAPKENSLEEIFLRLTEQEDIE